MTGKEQIADKSGNPSSNFAAGSVLRHHEEGLPPNEVNGHEGNEVWDGTHNKKHDNRAEAMTGPLKWSLVNASKGHGFLSPSAAP